MSGKLSERKEMQIRICGKKMEYRFEDILEIRNGKNQKAVENPEGRYPIYGSGGVIGYADDYICEADTIIIGRKGSINNPIYASEPFWNVDTAFGLSVKKDFVLPRYLYYFCKKFDFGKLNLSELEKYASLLKSALSNGEISRDELNKFKIDLISAEGVIRQFDVELANMRGDEKFAKDIQNATVQLQNLQNQMLSYLKNTPNLSASTRNAIQSRYDNITQIINSGTATDKNVLDARDFFSAIQRDAKIAGEEVESFGGKIRRLFREHFNTAVAMAGVHLLQTAMRELWQNVQDVDAAMTELKKVTDLSDSSALEFMDKAAVKAKELGASMSGYINSVADWSRLGYKLDDAEMLADASQLYLNVGDDVDDINESTSTLISTVRAFKLEASDAAGVVDKLNEVSNNYATSAGDIGAALARSSAALFAGGNSLEESIALITAAQSTIQDAEKVGGHMRPTA